MSAVDDIRRALYAIRSITAQEQTAVRLEALELMSSMIASELLIIRSTGIPAPKTRIVTKTRVLPREASSKPKPQTWLPTLLATLDQPAPPKPAPPAVIRPVPPVPPTPTVK